MLPDQDGCYTSRSVAPWHARQRTSGQGRTVQPLATGTIPFAFTRTDFINARNCGGFAWLVKYRPSLVPIDSARSAQRKEQTRLAFARLLRDRFPSGVVIDATDFDLACANTAEAIAAGNRIIFNATVRTKRGLVAVADVLAREGEAWHLYDVRSTTGVRTEHVLDTAYQAVVFAEAGVPIECMHILSLRKEYRRQGTLSLDELTRCDDVTARVRRQWARVQSDITRAVPLLADPYTPAICLCDMGTRSQRCPTFDHFHPELPRRGTIYDLGGVSAETLGQALERGVLHLVDWPDDITIDSRQSRQVQLVRSGEPVVDGARLAEFVRGLEYPLHFLDYETFQTAIPLFDGCRPWAHIPFQYSMHIVSADGAITHRSFLWEERDASPVPALLDALHHDIGPFGSIVVWNRGFEESRNRDMAEMIPEAAAFLDHLNSRIVDLMDVVTQEMWVHPEFNGSSSIKKVLPVAEPGLSYDALAIGDGALASERWFEAVMGEPGAVTDAERADILDALAEYSHLDTLAMVRILDHLRDLVDASDPIFGRQLAHTPASLAGV
jgi:hypothetical protein